MRKIRDVNGEERGRRSHTPLFHRSQNPSRPWSKATVKAKEPAKMLATKTPVRENVNFTESGQSVVGKVVLFRRAKVL